MHIVINPDDIDTLIRLGRLDKLGTQRQIEQGRQREKEIG